MNNTADIRSIFGANIQTIAIMNLGKILSQPLGSCSIPSAAIKKEMAIPLAVPIAAAAVGAIGKLLGNSSAAEAERERQRMLQAERAKSDAYYRRMINQNFTDTAYGQNWMRIARDEADKIWKREAGATAVTGRTAAADAMAKDAANKLVGDAIASGEAQEAMRKDSLEASKRAADSQFAQQEMADQAAKRDRLSAAGDGLLSLGLNTAAMMFPGTKLGQSWMGTGSTTQQTGSSPAGGGGATTAQPANALQQMGITKTVSPGYQIYNPYGLNNMMGGFGYLPVGQYNYRGTSTPWDK